MDKNRSKTSGSEKIILGIDPGTNVMGYGVILIQSARISLLSAGVVRMEKLENQALKLRSIFQRTLQIIDEHHPDELAVEAPFFGKNVQSMLKLGRAQGVAIAAALHRDIPVFEYSPKKIKQSVTGNGNASKEQVAAMLQRLLKISQAPKFLDATDALAAALCHHFQGGQKSSQRKSAGWKNFIRDNPGRVSGQP